jgi:hypothetical protein
MHIEEAKIPISAPRRNLDAVKNPKKYKLTQGDEWELY